MSASAPRRTLGSDDWVLAGALVTEVAFSHRARWNWLLAAAIGFALVGVLVASLGAVLFEGVGVWGNNIPVTWALDIVGYDWWIGVATGCLALSAIMLLTQADGRGVVNRLAETAALLSVVAAGLYPIVHLGRPWFFYWNLPYPNTFLLWPQVRSPLYWDAVDIVSFLFVSLCFWFMGLIPDYAAMRDRAREAMRSEAGRPGAALRRFKAQAYGVAAIGWRGSATHWGRWLNAYRSIAAMSVVLVMSLQTGAAVMFSGSPEPGWHDALLPVSYLCGAVLSGVGMVAVLLVVVRAAFPLHALIRDRHLNRLAILLLCLALANAYCYGASIGIDAVVGGSYGHAVSVARFAGPHAWAAWTIIGCGLLPPQLLWVPRLRISGPVVATVGALAMLGAWADHFMVIVVTLQHDFLPSSDHPYAIDVVGVATFVGTVGLFVTGLLLFLRYLPIVSALAMRRELLRLPPPQAPL